jgi:hypothetical protein
MEEKQLLRLHEMQGNAIAISDHSVIWHERVFKRLCVSWIDGLELHMT